MFNENLRAQLKPHKVFDVIKNSFSFLNSSPVWKIEIKKILIKLHNSLKEIKKVLYGSYQYVTNPTNIICHYPLAVYRIAINSAQPGNISKVKKYVNMWPVIYPLHRAEMTHMVMTS